MPELMVNGVSKIKDPKLVLFDKDGTIIDIHHYWASMIQFRAEHIVEQYAKDRADSDEIKSRLMDEMGVDLDCGRMKPQGPVGIKPRSYIAKVASDVMNRYGVSVNTDQIESLFAEVDIQTSLNMKPLLKLLPGVRSLLDSLNACGISSAIVSVDIADRAEKAVTVLGLESYFDFIIGGDLVEHVKPAPDMAILAMNKNGVLPESTVVIGDHPVDIKMGQGAGIELNIGVLNGLSDVSMFNDLECETISDLTKIRVRC